MRDDVKAAAAFTIAVTVLLVSCVVVWRFTIDDAFISLRYARNWANGRGVVYNEGEYERAYSNPTWVALAAAAMRAGCDGEQAVKVLGLIFSTLSLWLVYTWARREGAGPWAGLASLVLVASPSTVIWTVGGLETPLYVTAVLLLFIPYEHERAWYRPAAALLVASTRPEGAGLAFIGLVYHCFIREDQGRPRGSLSYWSVSACVWLFMQVVMRVYYGAWVPTSYQMKFFGNFPGARFSIVSQLKGPFLHWFLHLLLPVALGALEVSAGCRREDVAPAFAVLYMMFVALVTWDWTPAFRYYAPVTAILSVYSARGFRRLLGCFRSEAAGTGSAAGLVRSAGVFVLLLCLFVPEFRELAGACNYARRYTRGMDRAFRPVGLWLREHSRPEDVICLARIGAIPYYASRRTIGLDGLIHLAFIQGGMKPDYVFSRKPRFIVLQSKDADNPTRTTDRFLKDIQDDPRFDRFYRHVATFGDASLAGVDAGFFAIFERRHRGVNARRENGGKDPVPQCGARPGTKRVVNG